MTASIANLDRRPNLRKTGRLAMAVTDTGAIAGAITRLRSLDLEGLRPEWRREPPPISRDLFVLGLGYRLQEIAQGRAQ